jgi:hypothetical protein
MSGGGEFGLSVFLLRVSYELYQSIEICFESIR